MLEGCTKEGIKKLREVVENAKKGTQLYSLIARESRQRLDGYKHIYFSLDEEDVSEMGGKLEEGLLETTFIPSKNIMVGSIDENAVKRWSPLSENKRFAMVEHPILTEKIICYMPIVKDWVKKRLGEKVDSLGQRNILRAIYEAMDNIEWKKELVVERDQGQMGKIAEILYK